MTGSEVIVKSSVIFVLQTHFIFLLFDSIKFEFIKTQTYIVLYYLNIF